AGHADGHGTAPVAAPADGRRQHVASLLLVGVRRRRRWGDAGHPRAAGKHRPGVAVELTGPAVPRPAADRRSGRSSLSALGAAGTGPKARPTSLAAGAHPPRTRGSPARSRPVS